ncbi:MAG: phage holin family protein [Gammaproteobacteria bacterium]
MENGKSKIGLIEVINQIFKNFNTIIIKTITLARLELQLAGKSLLIVIILSLVSGLFLLCFWVLAFIALALWLTTLHLNMALSFLLVALLNLLLVVPLLIFILRAKRDIHLPVLSRQMAVYSKDEKTYEKINSETEKFAPKN